MQKIGLIVVLAALLAVGLSGVARADDMAKDGMSSSTGAGKGVSVKKTAKKKSPMHKVGTSKVTGKTEADSSDAGMAK